MSTADATRFAPARVLKEITLATKLMKTHISNAEPYWAISKQPLVVSNLSTFTPSRYVHTKALNFALYDCKILGIRVGLFLQ